MTNWIASLLLTSITMSIILFIIMAFHALFPKILSAKAKYFIWVIVLLGFVIPFRPVIGNGLIHIQVPEAVPLPSDVYNNQTDSSSPSNGIINEEIVKKEPGTNNEPTSPISVLLFVWGFVAVTILAYQFWRYRHFIRMIRRWGVEIEEDTVVSIFQTMKNELGLESKTIRLMTCGFISSSMLTGFTHPVILLPERSFDEEELRLIFKHELIHYKRHDLIIKLLTVIATSMHWFNPFVYWMNNTIQTDGEASCDEAVLQDADEENRQFYGEIIIGMIGKKNTARTALSTYFYARRLNLKRRLESILDSRCENRRRTFLGIFSIAILILISGSIITITQKPSNATNITNTSPTPTTSPSPTHYSINESEITESEAIEIALSKVGGGTIIQCGLDYEDGRKIYDVKVENGNQLYEMNVDAVHGTITEYETETIQSNTTITSPPNNEASIISEAKARDIALGKVGGGTIVQCELDYEDGRKIYDVKIEFGNKLYQMEVDATNGTITDYEMDDDGHNDYDDD